MRRYGGVLFVLVAALFAASSANAAEEQPFPATVGVPFKVFDSTDHGVGFAYAPSTILVEGTYYQYFCASGTSDIDWDHVLMRTSLDGILWSDPILLMRPTPRERSNCDPSLVWGNIGDGWFYYMLYSGNRVDVQTVNHVARSVSPIGPFLKLTERGTWEADPDDVRVIAWPHRPAPEASGIYGAGQPTVLVRDGVGYQWYTDDTVDGLPRILIATYTGGDAFNPPQATNIVGMSVDVKYDAATGLFVMFEILDAHLPSARLAVRGSRDGIQFGEPLVVCDEACFPDWAHNVGVVGDREGNVVRGVIPVTFGAPYDLNPLYQNDCETAPSDFLCWAAWDLYSVWVDVDAALGELAVSLRE